MRLETFVESIVQDALGPSWTFSVGLAGLEALRSERSTTSSAILMAFSSFSENPDSSDPWVDTFSLWIVGREPSSLAFSFRETNRALRILRDALHGQVWEEFLAELFDGPEAVNPSSDTRGGRKWTIKVRGGSNGYFQTGLDVYTLDLTLTP